MLIYLPFGLTINKKMCHVPGVPVPLGRCTPFPQCIEAPSWSGGGRMGSYVTPWSLDAGQCPTKQLSRDSNGFLIHYFPIQARFTISLSMIYLF